MILAVIALGAMALYVVSSICARSLVGKGLPGSVEGVILLMMVTAWLSLADTQRLKGHIKVEIFTQHLPWRTQSRLEFGVLLLVLGFICVMLWQSIDAAYYSWHAKEFLHGIVRFPTWPAKLCFPIGLSALALQLLADVLAHFKRAKSG